MHCSPAFTGIPFIWDATRLLSSGSLSLEFSKETKTKSFEVESALRSSLMDLVCMISPAENIIDGAIAGHSLGLDVHDVPSASKPDEKFNMTIPEESRQNPEFYRYLRLRLPLEAGMVLVGGCRIRHPSQKSLNDPFLF